MNKINKFLLNIAVFFAIFLILNAVFKSCQNEPPVTIDDKNPIVLTSSKNDFSRLETIKIDVQNNTKEELTIKNNCPSEPLKVYRYENGTFINKTVSPKLNCEDAQDYKIEPGKKTQILFDNWSYALFNEMGRYKTELTLSINNEEKTFTSNEFIVEKEGIFKQILYALFYKPIYNLLAVLLAYLPYHDLGIAIIILTILIRTILLIPNNKAMLSQRRLSELQPKLEKIKEKYKGDQQKISLETMALWKSEKVNPFGSCLPLLMQFPILIALFYVIRGGLNPDYMHLLYTHYQGFEPEKIHTLFLGILDLTKPNLYVLPLLIGGLQFLQLKLAQIKKTKNKDSKPKDRKSVV